MAGLLLAEDDGVESAALGRLEAEDAATPLIEVVEADPRLERLRADGLAQCRRQRVSTLTVESETSLLARIDRFYELFNTPSARESAFATMHAVLDTRSTVARTSRVKKPTYVVWGRSDALYPSPLAPRLARELSAERLEVMETGHAPHMERPAAFVESVCAFLASTKGKR